MILPSLPCRPAVAVEVRLVGFSNRVFVHLAVPMAKFRHLSGCVCRPFSIYVFILVWVFRPSGWLHSRAWVWVAVELLLHVLCRDRDVFGLANVVLLLVVSMCTLFVGLLPEGRSELTYPE